jgi:hypothetical protein
LGILRISHQANRHHEAQDNAFEHIQNLYTVFYTQKAIFVSISAYENCNICIWHTLIIDLTPNSKDANSVVDTAQM